MEKIDKIKSAAVLMPVENIDTDQIIPARFLKTTSRDGFGEKLFYDWRFNADGTQNTLCPLNGRHGIILVAGNNFGCGSSREHAAWALHDAGFRAVVSTSFADIFKNNALNNQILPVAVSPSFHAKMMERLLEEPDKEVEIDLERQTVSLEGAGCESFAIGAYKKECLMKGYSDIDYLLANKDDILAYEAGHENL